MQKVILLLCSICLLNAAPDLGSTNNQAGSALNRQQKMQIVSLSNVLNSAQDSISERMVILAFKELSNLTDPQTLCSIASRIQVYSTKRNLNDIYYCSDNIVSDMVPLDGRFYVSFLKKLSLKIEKDAYDKFVKLLQAELDDDLWSEISKKIAPAQVEVVQQDPKIVVLSGIINRIASMRSLPQDLLFSIFDQLQDKIDDPLLFQLINGLQSADLKKQFMDQYFPSGYKSGAKTTTVLDNQFYATFLDTLSNVKDISDDLMDKISEGMKPYLRKDWDAIAKLRQQSPSADPWGQVTSSASLELDKILKSKTPNMNAVKAQLVLDFVEAYKQAPDQAPSAGFGDDNKPASFAKIRNAVDSIKATYQAKLSQKNIQADGLLAPLDVTFNEATAWAVPRFTVSFYNQYVNNITTADTKNKVLNGFRIDVEKAFVDYQTAKGNKSVITFNSDYMYLLCFQMLGGLEATIIKSQSSSKYDDFEKQAVDTLDKLAQGLNHEGNIDGIIQSIKSGIPSRIEKTPDSVILGRFVGLIINKLQIPSDVLGMLNAKLKVPLTELQTSSESVKAFEGVLKGHLEALSKITTVNASNVVSFMSVTAPVVAQAPQAESKDDDLIEKAKKLADSPIGKNIFGKLGGLFG